MLAKEPSPRHGAVIVSRPARPQLVSLAVACVTVAAGCLGNPLSAGSDDAGAVLAVPPTVAPVAPTTRVTLTSMIDTFAMDEANLYFTAEDGSLYGLAKTGTSPPTKLASAATAGSEYTEGLTLDDENLYWTSLGDGVSTGVVLTVAKTGGAAVALATNQARPTGIAVDDAFVYWTNQGTPPPDATNDVSSAPASVMSIPKTGGTPTTLVSNPTVPDKLTLDPTGVIWHEQYAIRRIPKSGGTPTTLTELAIPWSCSNLVVSGTSLYWAADQGGWSLEAIALGGGVVATLAASIETPGAIAVDGSSILWDVGAGATVGAIEAEPLVGGSAGAEVSQPDVVTGSTGEQASFFLVDASAFYWVEYWQAAGATVPTVVIRVRAR
jgi:hypothetical protein